MHFIDSMDPIISIKVLMEMACSYGSLRPSNFMSDDDLKLFGTGRLNSRLRKVRGLELPRSLGCQLHAGDAEDCEHFL